MLTYNSTDKLKYFNLIYMFYISIICDAMYKRNVYNIFFN